MKGVELDFRKGVNGEPFLEMIFDPTEMNLSDREIYIQLMEFLENRDKYFIGMSLDPYWKLDAKLFQLPKEFQEKLEKGEFNLQELPDIYKKRFEVLTLYAADIEKIQVQIKDHATT